MHQTAGKIPDKYGGLLSTSTIITHFSKTQFYGKPGMQYLYKYDQIKLYYFFIKFTGNEQL